MEQECVKVTISTKKTETKPEQETEIDSTKWHAMTLQQLNVERDKVVNKMSLLHGMMGYNSNISIYGLYTALQHALTVLDELIANRMQE